MLRGGSEPDYRPPSYLLVVFRLLQAAVRVLQYLRALIEVLVDPEIQMIVRHLASSSYLSLKGCQSMPAVKRWLQNFVEHLLVEAE